MSEPEPTGALAVYQSIKRVKAGEIVEVRKNGCYVRDANGTARLRLYQPGMTARYIPAVGDFWIVYDDRYESLSPREAFVAGYVELV